MRYDRDFREGRPRRAGYSHDPGEEYAYERFGRGGHGRASEHVHGEGYAAAYEDEPSPRGGLRSPYHDERLGRGEYGAAYEAGTAPEWEERVPARGRHPRRGPRPVFRGYQSGFGGGSLRSRGSFQAGQLRSGLNADDDFEFEWGEGYVGGRGYGGTNYDLRHGYRVGSPRSETRRGWSPPTDPAAAGRGHAATERATGTPGAPRGGYEWGQELQQQLEREPYGPARYGYGPYHDRLRRRRRSDDEIREDVEETLFYDTWVDADRIEVTVEDGVVTLRGTLPSYDEVRYATDDAWDVDGVRGVRSELDVGEPGSGGGGEGEGQGGGADQGEEHGQQQGE